MALALRRHRDFDRTTVLLVVALLSPLLLAIVLSFFTSPPAPVEWYPDSSVRRTQPPSVAGLPDRSEDDISPR
jgi:hypothetical protein